MLQPLGHQSWGDLALLQNINILTLGNPEGKVGPGRYVGIAHALLPVEAAEMQVQVCCLFMQEATAELGKLGKIIGVSGPFKAPGQADLTQALGGQFETASGNNRQKVLRLNLLSVMHHWIHYVSMVMPCSCCC